MIPQMKNKKNNFISFRISPEEKKRMIRCAEKNNCSLSELVMNSISSQMERHGKKDFRRVQELTDRTLLVSMIGRVLDQSIESDEYVKIERWMLKKIYESEIKLWENS